MILKYILDPNDPNVAVPCEDVVAFAEWFGSADRTVAKDTAKGLVVSTVFLAFDHNYTDTGPPVLWEMMLYRVSDGKFLDYQERYTSRQSALDGHKRWVEQVQKGKLPECHPVPKDKPNFTPEQVKWLEALFDSVPVERGEFTWAQCETLAYFRNAIS